MSSKYNIAMAHISKTVQDSNANVERVRQALASGALSRREQIEMVFRAIRLNDEMGRDNVERVRAAFEEVLVRRAASKASKSRSRSRSGRFLPKFRLK